MIGIECLVARNAFERIVVDFRALVRARSRVQAQRRREDRRAIQVLAHELIEKLAECRRTGIVRRKRGSAERRNIGKRNCTGRGAG